MSQPHNDLAIIILAAGKGKRMKSDIPKVLQPIAHKPMLAHILDRTTELNPQQIITVVSPDTKEPIKQALKHYGHTPTLAIQTKQLGTANAVAAAIGTLTSTPQHTLIVNGDTPLITTESLERLLESKADLTVLSFIADEPYGYGRIITDPDDDEILLNIVEEKDADDDERDIILCNSGIMLFNHEMLASQLPALSNTNASNEFYLTDMARVIRATHGKCHHILGDDIEVLGANTRAELSILESLMQTRLRLKHMDHGVTMQAPMTVFMSHDTHIEPGTIIEPFVTIGPGVTIGKDSVIRSFSHLEHCTIGNECTIGPYARLRPGTILKDHARVGNFVEIKNSEIGEGSKVNHLSYIGDATLGQDVNIGAGTITCNYDGTNKYETTIGNRSFIGSNSALVAPLTIGENVTIGAGSTITEHISDNTLAIARQRQVLKDKAE